MRMLALVTDAFGGSGGIAQYNRNFIEACASFEELDEILVLPRQYKNDAQTSTHRIQNLRSPNTKPGYVLRAVALSIRSRPIDIVFCGHVNLCILSYLIARLSRAQLWLQVHGVEAWQQPGRLRRWTVERADLVTSVSRYTRRRVLSWANLSPQRVRVISNTVSKRFEPGTKPGYLVERYKLNNKKIILTVGRLTTGEQYKGHDRVIAMLPELLKSIPDILYMIAGEGSDKPRLQKLAERLGVDKSVRFLGKVANEELPDLYRLADLFVMPSTGEGFGIVYLEALASGVPVVASLHGGSVDALRNGQYGSLVEDNHLFETIKEQMHDGNRFSCANEVRAVFGFNNFERCTHGILSMLSNSKLILADGCV